MHLNSCGLLFSADLQPAAIHVMISLFISSYFFTGIDREAPYLFIYFININERIYVYIHFVRPQVSNKKGAILKTTHKRIYIILHLWLDP